MAQDTVLTAGKAPHAVLQQQQHDVPCKGRTKRAELRPSMLRCVMGFGSVLRISGCEPQQIETGKNDCARGISCSSYSQDPR